MMFEARFRRRISVASNAMQTIDNEVSHLIIYCFNCIRNDGNSTSKTGLTGLSKAHLEIKWAFVIGSITDELLMNLRNADTV